MRIPSRDLFSSLGGLLFVVAVVGLGFEPSSSSWKLVRVWGFEASDLGVVSALLVMKRFPACGGVYRL